ncbi:hypothetical protein GCG21_11840 [Pseudactinotalea sp. HY160]|uniref:hypothetical protein n=1 Tax=Pseudactinotalea sp. HY160 TaxID=2654490 RepID=UPI00128CD8CF|nr:hypothetical protein [Pseudactinotalea sp. HY160]MPV50683.1 hypothetical protein [Pseudactinotalea sp. HY160]
MALVTCASAALLVALIPGLLAPVGPLAAVSNPVGVVAVAAGLLPVAVAAINVSFLAGLIALRRRVRTVEARLRLVFWLGTANLLVGLLFVSAPAGWTATLRVPGNAQDCCTVR